MISIHAPRGGSDSLPNSARYSFGIFQSTLPVGGATLPNRADRSAGIYFNPRSPWGERRGGRQERGTGRRFQSTLPVGGATKSVSGASPQTYISIHAPRGGSDWAIRDSQGLSRHFNPRSPWGERLPPTIQVITGNRFQSTLPVGGATRNHIPCAGHHLVFQSTLPVGGATNAPGSLPTAAQISIHAPRGGSDGAYALPGRLDPDFNPRSPWGERPACLPQTIQGPEFQSTLPVGGATGAPGCILVYY